MHQTNNKVIIVGSRPITNEKSNVLFNKTTPFSIKTIRAVRISLKKKNIYVEPIKGDRQKRISNDGKNIYVKKGINRRFAKIVIHVNSKK